MIYLLRCNTIQSDSRALKYIDFYQRNNYPYMIVGWDRTNENVNYPNAVFYKKKSKYNLGGAKAALHRLCWMFFLLKFLIKSRKNISTIHACDLDTAFPAALFKMLTRSKSVLVFDVFDWFSDTQSVCNSRLFKSISGVMERVTVHYSNLLIICEKERIRQIPFKVNKPILVLPNIPSFYDDSFLEQTETYRFNNDKIVLSYVGGFSNDRFIEELLNIAEKGVVNLLIAGYGDEEIVTRCINLSKANSNIKYFGKVPYKIGLNIMYNSDIIYAMYSKSTPNNIYAAPNKYYESMMLSKAIISTKGTILENKIVGDDIGFVVEEDEREITALLQGLSKEECYFKGIKAHSLWMNTYMSYTSDFMKNQYSKTLR